MVAWVALPLKEGRGPEGLGVEIGVLVGVESEEGGLAMVRVGVILGEEVVEGVRVGSLGVPVAFVVTEDENVADGEASEERDIEGLEDTEREWLPHLEIEGDPLPLLDVEPQRVTLPHWESEGVREGEGVPDKVPDGEREMEVVAEVVDEVEMERVTEEDCVGERLMDAVREGREEGEMVTGLEVITGLRDTVTDTEVERVIEGLGEMVGEMEEERVMEGV